MSRETSRLLAMVSALVVLPTLVALFALAFVVMPIFLPSLAIVGGIMKATNR